ncbi:GNAT family N-acetyltransferase [Vampirovibrio chlorellavorus]|uniref:GNAT family N-acetyltransferase n=1 Tax=Vampirovibrio chlorellavorus TaxID=758823 RepID=UPI0026E9BBB3|nr:GNAT family N-acetyltransferase [Vampirovibrio chlorellavorus]
MSKVLQMLRFRPSESPEAFVKAQALRTTVFIEEQGIPPELEWDEFDADALHWLFMQAESGQAVATARILSYQEACQARPVAKIGRVAVSQACRGQGIGEKLMRELLTFAQAEGYQQAILDAQTRAVPFYERLGFVKEGFEFMEAGIPHYRMRLVF